MAETIVTKWRGLDIRTKIALISAMAAFVIGWGLTIAGFFAVPIGVISDSVLWVLGQALVYAASIFGVGMYTNKAVKDMKAEINDFLGKKNQEKEEEQ